MEFKEIVSRVIQTYKELSKIEAVNIKTWIDEVHKLYQTIQEWLSEYIDQGDVIVEQGEFQHYEFNDDVGTTYTMHIYFGSDLGPSIVFEPTGINIAEALGKIDMYYLGHKEDAVSLLLTKESDEGLSWKIMKNSNNCKNFSKELFERQIIEWMTKWAGVQG